MSQLRFAFRTLRKTPFVTGLAIVSLALGLGANSAIFSLFHQVVLRPLPVLEPDRLVNLGAPGPKQGSQSCNQAGDCDAVFSYPMFRDLERVQTVLTGLAAHRTFGATHAYQGRAKGGEGLLVSGAYFAVLGLQPALGRLLGPEDDRGEEGSRVVVLSHEYWRRHLAEDPAVLGQGMTVNGQALAIVGVAPRGFGGTTLGANPEVFVPLALHRSMQGPFVEQEERKAYWLYLFGRLNPGVSIEQARAALDVPYRAILHEVEVPLQSGMSDDTMARFRARQITLEPGRRGQSSLHAEARTPLLILFAVTAVVLLIACANVANLLLARSAARASEIAVRLSVGASRRRLVGQLLLESCLLALLGGAAGLVVAGWTLDLIASMLPGDATAVLAFELSLPAVAFAGGLALSTGVVFGLFPALQSTRPDLAATLKGQAGQPGGSRGAARFRAGLVTAQIALSMALLASAGLFLKSLVRITRVDIGLRTEDVVTFHLSPVRIGYTPERALALFENVERELARIPGATGVTASMVPILSGSNWGSNVSVQGFEAGPDTDTNARFNNVGPGYFRTLGIRLMAGREFDERDAAGAPKVAVVNEAFTRKFGLGRDAVGKRMKQGSGGELDLEIVGVVRDAKYSEVKAAVPPLFFRPCRQDPQVRSLSFYVRTGLAPESFLRAVPAVVAGLDPELPVEELRTLPQQIRENVFLDRLIGTLAAGFATLATVLAAVGLYGVLAYTVAQRTREIGLRMALGADRRRVRAMVLGGVGRLTLLGGTIGVGLALAVGTAARSLLFEVEGHDPLVLAGAAALLTLVALGAGWLPATRASRVDPMRALRYE